MVEVPVSDEDKQLTVTQGDAIVLHCPLYQAALHAENITWYHGNEYYEVDVSRTKAISDNGSQHVQHYLFASERNFQR